MSAAPIEKLKKQNGGARPGAGRKKGGKNQATVTKEAARELLRQRVMQHFGPLIDAQVANAKGINYLVVRDVKTGKFVRVGELRAKTLKPDEEIIEIWEKEPSVSAFTDLMNRTLDKAAEQVLEVHVITEAEIEARLKGARTRVPH
ncbi:MAG: hypothetical protein NTY02_01650 [Acidobacteria bacterium]|nr:hypothetical protein [Acidobacteriota bacterium]